jgi:cytochrome c553
MRCPVLCCLGWLFVGVLLPTAHGASSALDEFASVLRCKPNEAHGQMLFDTCAACHGNDGSGATDGTVPGVAAQHFRVVVHELVGYRHEERSDPRMEHFTDDHHLSGLQDIADVAAYVSRLPPTHSSALRGGEEMKKAAEIYAGRCASCHGDAGEGNNVKRYPRLAGQHPEYLLEQLQEAAEGRRPHFPPAHIRLLQSVNRTDFVGIADYLSRLGP